MIKLMSINVEKFQDSDFYKRFCLLAYSSLRVLSLEQGWRILFADCLEDGLRLQRLNKVWILVYDRDLPGVDWRQGLRTLLTSLKPFFRS